MDPQKTWEQLLAAYAQGDYSAIEEHATALLRWLDDDGPPPAVAAQDAGSEWNSALARAGCLHALETLHDTWCVPQE